MRKLATLFFLALCAITAGTAAAAQNDFNTLSAGLENTCGATRGGILKCWGNNDYGQVTGTPTPGVGVNIPHAIPGMTSVSQVAVSGDGYSICALQFNQLWCWGQNDRGQLGQGDTLNRAHPTLVPGFGSGVTSVATARLHTCAVIGSRNYCWGDNSQGQLGLGTLDTANHYSPVLQHAAANVVSVAANRYNTCIMINAIPGGAQTLRCWGANSFGQLGRQTSGVSLGTEGPDIIYQVPGCGRCEPTPATTFTKVSVGWGHICGLTALHQVYCWGDNSDGQLGINSSVAMKTIPTKIFLPSYATTALYLDIAVGGKHSMALVTGAYGQGSDDSQLVVWGSGRSGRNGVGPGNPNPTPANPACGTAPILPPPFDGSVCDKFYPSPPETLNAGVPTLTQWTTTGSIITDGGYHWFDWMDCGPDEPTGQIILGSQPGGFYYNPTCNQNIPGVMIGGGGNGRGQLGTGGYSNQPVDNTYWYEFWDLSTYYPW